MKCFIIATVFVTLQFKLVRSLTCEESYCYGKEPPPDYPLKTITDLVKELNMQSLDDTEMRQGYPTNLASEACETTEIDDPIYQIIDENNKKRHVVQVEDRFLQILRIIKCDQEDVYEERLPLFYQEMLELFKVSCKTRNVKIRFLVLSEDGQGLEMATAKDGIPLGCFCRYDEKAREDRNNK